MIKSNHDVLLPFCILSRAPCNPLHLDAAAVRSVAMDPSSLCRSVEPFLAAAGGTSEDGSSCLLWLYIPHTTRRCLAHCFVHERVLNFDLSPLNQVLLLRQWTAHHIRRLRMSYGGTSGWRRSKLHCSLFCKCGLSCEYTFPLNLHFWKLVKCFNCRSRGV